MLTDHPTQNGLETSAVTSSESLCVTVTWKSYLQFLLGRSPAIWRVARARHGWILGAIFVLSAGFAREYDRSDLLAEPYHLALPFVASVISSLLLYGVVMLYSLLRGKGSNPSYVEFLQTYWATAPLAWLYALPVERWLDEANAVTVNFWFLGIVAVWRVVLMVRTITTLWGVHAAASAAIVLAFGDAVLFTALTLSPAPVLDVMSGNRLSPAEQVLARVHFQAIILSALSAPLWMIGLGIPFQKALWSPPARPITPSPRIAFSGWVIGATTLVIGGWLCLIGQPPLQRATVVNRMVYQDDFTAALSYLATHPPEDFPPHWDVPPNPNYSYQKPDAARLARFYLAAQTSGDSSQWVRERLTDKLLRAFQSWALSDQIATQLSEEELEGLIAGLEQFQEAGGVFPHYSHLHLQSVDAPSQLQRAALLEKLHQILDPHPENPATH